MACNEGFESTSAGRFTCVACGANEVYDKPSKTCKSMNQFTGWGVLHPMFNAEKCPYGMYSDNDSTQMPNNERFDCMYLDEGRTCGSACNVPAGSTACPNGYWCNGADEYTGAIHK